MKKKRLKKLALDVKTISNLQSDSLKGGETCESPCQGGTGCCNATENCYDCKYNCLFRFWYSLKVKCLM